MKKIAVFVFSLICALACLWATPNSGINDKVCEIFTELEGIPASEKSRFVVNVSDKLQANLYSYADFRFVSGDNKDKIIELQRQSESVLYNQNTAIEVGELTSANYGIFVKIIKSGAKYTLSIKYVDLTSGDTIPVIGMADSAEELYANYGSTVDQLTIKLCDALGRPLSNADRYILINGDKDLTADQKSKLYNDKVKLFQDQLKELDSKLNNLAFSDYKNNDEFKSQLETEKKLAAEKLKIAQENQRRAEEEAKKQKEDEERNKKRSAAQKETINKMSIELQEKYEELQKKNFYNEPILSQIKIIELKKKALIEIQDDIDAEVLKLNEQANIDIDAKLQEITDRPISVVEQGNTPDSLSAGAKENRAREFQEEKKKITENLKKDVKQITDKLQKENKKLLNEIHKDYNSLKNKTVSSFDDDLTVDYGNYDGNRGGWPLFITVRSDGEIIFNTTSFLSYEELTGNKAINDNRDPNYKDFAIDVDTFESMFLRGEPILTYEIEYTITPYAPKYPSKYRFKFNYLKYYDTRKMSLWGGKLRSTKTGFLTLDHDIISREFDPKYDISAIEDNKTASIKIDEVAYVVPADEDSQQDFSDFSEEDYFNYDYDFYEREIERQKLLEEQERKQQEEIEKEQEKQRKKAEKAEKSPRKYPSGHDLFGINAGWCFNKMEGPSLEIEFDKSVGDMFYFGIGATGILPTKGERYEVIPDISLLVNGQFKLGMNIDLFLFNLYSSFGVGANYFTYVPALAKSYVNIPQKIIDDWRFAFTFEIGGNIPIGSHFAISCGYLLIAYDVEEKKISTIDNIDFGIAITF